MGWEDRGIVSQSEVMNKGDIEGHSSLVVAKELGNSI